MEYVQPLGEAADASYVDANPGTGTEGSTVPAAALEDAQREIVNAITAAGLVPDGGNLTQLTQAIALLASGQPVGTFFWYIGATPPSNALVMDGAAGLSRAAYSDLFDHLDDEGLIVTEGTKDEWEFGDGDGATTFSLGDYRGEFIRAFDGGRGVDIGRVLASWQADEFKEHDHPSSGTTAASTIQEQGDSGDSSITARAGSATGLSGGDETRPRNIALLPCIQYK